jgi:hypothetical protein
MHSVQQHQIWKIDDHYARVGSVLGDEVEMHLRGLSGVSDVQRFSAKSMLANPTRFEFIRDGYALKTKSELEALIMEKALQHPVCPEGMGVRVQRHPDGTWSVLGAVPPPPGTVAHSDCVHHIYEIANELRGKYDLAAE